MFFTKTKASNSSGFFTNCDDDVVLSVLERVSDQQNTIPEISTISIAGQEEESMENSDPSEPIAILNFEIDKLFNASLESKSYLDQDLFMAFAKQLQVALF
jgi:hypothetical protein